MKTLKFILLVAIGTALALLCSCGSSEKPSEPPTDATYTVQLVLSHPDGAVVSEPCISVGHGDTASFNIEILSTYGFRVYK